MVGSTQNSLAYSISGNGPYAIPFRYDHANWIVATLTDADGETTTLSLTTQYTLGGNGPLATGTLSLVGSYTNGHTLTIWREAPGLQSLDLDAGPMPHASLEAQLDRLAMAGADTVRPRNFWTLSNLVNRLLELVENLTPGGGGGGGGGSSAWADITGKPTTFPPSIGAAADQAVAGNDNRLTNARTPVEHSHASADISDASAFYGVSNVVLRGDEGEIRAGTDITEPKTAMYPDLTKVLRHTNALGGSVTFKVQKASSLSQHEYTFPDQSGTLAMTDAPNTFSGENAFPAKQTFSQFQLYASVTEESTDVIRALVDAPQHGFSFQWMETAESPSAYHSQRVGFYFRPDYSYFFSTTTLTAPRTYTFPDASGYVLLTNANNGRIPGSYANDAAAASAGVPVGWPYHTSGAVKVRLS